MNFKINILMQAYLVKLFVCWVTENHQKILINKKQLSTNKTLHIAFDGQNGYTKYW